MLTAAAVTVPAAEKIKFLSELPLVMVSALVLLLLKFGALVEVAPAVAPKFTV